MYRTTGILAAITLLCAGMTGCENTGQAVEKDAAADSQAVSKSVNGAAKEVGDVSHNAVAASTVTPKVKTQIIEDAVLRSSSNNIHVSSTETTVTLEGHVVTDVMKRRASEDAQVGLQKLNAHQKVVNLLKVTGGGK
ncbi:MAG: hypothetical protein M3Y56_14590 [Armatimonadota bacterium]|nr:hypothetical protein [Armatimonadota bacterium]